MNEEIKEKTVILPPFKHFIMTVGAIPTSYLESMTYYEMLVWFTNYLGKTIIPAINENGEAVTELQNLFRELQDYVNNYFENLDVQEEINNKLDEMVEDGTLQEIVASYLESNVPWTFDTVADMKSATNLTDGSYAQTLGYYAANDGGAALYKITDDNSSTANYYESLGDGLYAMLIVNRNTINVKQFGAKADGITDDSSAIQGAVDYIKNNGILFITDSNWNEKSYMTLEFTPEKYYLGSTVDLDFPRNAYVDGKGCYIYSAENTIAFSCSDMMCHRALIKNMNFCSNYTAVKFDLIKKDCSSILFDGCRFMDCVTAIDMSNESTMTTFHKCHFLHCPTIYKTVSSDQTLFDDCWFSEYQHNENGATSFILSWGETIFKNCFFIPNGNYKQFDQSAYTGLAWIEMNNNTKLTIDNCRISGETNNKTIVNFKGAFNVQSPNNSGISIRNSSNLTCALGETLIRLYSMPNFINIDDCTLITRYGKFITLDESFDFDDWFNSLSPNVAVNRLFYACKISLRNISTQLSYPWDNFPKELIPFVRESDFPLYIPYDYETPEGKINLGYISRTTGEFSKYSYIFEFTAHNQSNPYTFTKYIGLVTLNVFTGTVDEVTGTFIKLNVTPITINKSVDEEVSVSAVFESTGTNTIKTQAGNIADNIILTYNGTVLDSDTKNLFSYKRINI